MHNDEEKLNLRVERKNKKKTANMEKKQPTNNEEEQLKPRI